MEVAQLIKAKICTAWSRLGLANWSCCHGGSYAGVSMALKLWPTPRRVAQEACSANTALSLTEERPRGWRSRAPCLAALGPHRTRSDSPPPVGTWNSTSRAFLTLIGARVLGNLGSETRLGLSASVGVTKFSVFWRRILRNHMRNRA